MAIGRLLCGYSHGVYALGVADPTAYDPPMTDLDPTPSAPPSLAERARLLERARRGDRRARAR